MYKNTIYLLNREQVKNLYRIKYRINILFDIWHSIIKEFQIMRKKEKGFSPLLPLLLQFSLQWFSLQSGLQTLNRGFPAVPKPYRWEESLAESLQL